VLAAAAAAGAKRCLVGIGGSATNDGGFGLARALGWQFLDHHGQPIKQWTGLNELAHIRPPRRRRWFDDLAVAVDVQNRLLGPRGASRVYGPQKGLRREDFAQAERCLGRLARIVSEQVAPGLARTPGAGAAGGLGFGLLAFLGARLEPGFELFARLANLDDHLQHRDLVLTGEGRLDASSLMGKGVGGLARRCEQRRIPCVGLAGQVCAQAQISRAFSQVRALTELAALQEAMACPARWLERSAECVARELSAMLRQWRHSSQAAT
jgi:glycerate kinase